MKEIRSKIKKIANHQKIINFLLDKSLKEENISTDLLNLNLNLLPREIFEAISSMRPLEISKILFEDIDYIKINDFELIDFKGTLTVFINIFDFVNVTSL